MPTTTGHQVHYLTVEETAARYRVSERTVGRLCRAGKLPAFRIGRQWRIQEYTYPGLADRVANLLAEVSDAE